MHATRSPILLAFYTPKPWCNLSNKCKQTHSKYIYQNNLQTCRFVTRPRVRPRVNVICMEEKPPPFGKTADYTGYTDSRTTKRHPASRGSAHFRGLCCLRLCSMRVDCRPVCCLGLVVLFDVRCGVLVALFVACCVVWVSLCCLTTVGLHCLRCGVCFVAMFGVTSCGFDSVARS